MKSIAINDAADRSYPFGRLMFEDRRVLYHGTWSTSSATVERDGFVGYCVPFDWQDIAVVYKANLALGRTSPLIISDSVRKTLVTVSTTSLVDRDLYLSANFWRARAYATDRGGEILRMTLELAGHVERICTSSEARAACRRHWQNGLDANPEHIATKKVVELLDDSEALDNMFAEVTSAKHRLINLTSDGYPVVYAITVEPIWFGENWEHLLNSWQLGFPGDLSCSCERVTVDRLVAKVSYVNGTEGDFIPAGFSTWEEALAWTRD